MSIKQLIMTSLALAISSILGSPAQATSYQTYVIVTYGGDDLIPAVRQQLNNSRDGGSVSTYQDKLVLQTTAANYRAIQQLLTQIDTQPQPVTVAVRVGNNGNEQSNIRQDRVIISNRSIEGAGIINQSNNQQRNNSLYQVQTLSGRTASISTNTLYSLTQTYQVNSYPTYNRPSAQIIIQQQVLLPTTRGIAVTPMLLANGQVEVRLSQAEETLMSDHRHSRYSHSRYNQNRVIESQRLDSTVIVPRGQWVTIGQVIQNNQSQSSSYSSNESRFTSNSAPIQLMVQ